MSEKTAPVSVKAAQSLERLRGEFPLEARLARASAPARQAYASILARWLDAEAPPGASEFPRDDLAELAALDAVALDAEGVSAYPFSARDTGIAVHLRGRRVGVMCAIDALAVSLLADTTVMIEATCERCQKPIRLEVRADGSWTSGATSAIRVRYPARRDAGSPCCSDLCPTIRFVLQGCEADSADEYLDLDEAIAVARGMFAFQGPLIQERKERLTAAPS